MTALAQSGAPLVGRTTDVAGIVIPSTSPVFIAGVGVHVAFGVAAVIAGAVAMLARKEPGRHPRAGTTYFWSLAGLFATAVALAAVRWTADYDLVVLGALAFMTAMLGRQARRAAWPGWARWHMGGMGLSYILALTAFYVDNGKNLPVWRNLPPLTYWLAPGAIGLPILAFNLLRHPLARRPSRAPFH